MGKKMKKTTFQLWIIGKDMLLENGVHLASTRRIWHFPVEHSGVNAKFEIEGNKPSDYFRAFFDDELMQKIVEENNNYQQQNPAPSVEKNAAWYDTNMAELYIFFATTILMRLNQKNRIKDYWSTDKLITTPIFGELFTRNRYLSVLRFLHFADNSTEQEGKLRKIQPIVENLRGKFEKPVVPWENLCIDESLMLWKGRLNFNKYAPRKGTDSVWSSSCYVIVIQNSFSTSLFTPEQTQKSTITLRLGHQVQ